MSICDSSAVLSPRLEKIVSTRAATESPLSKSIVEGAEPDDRWLSLFDQLREWERDPSQLADEGIDPPTKQSLELAVSLAESWRAAGAACPDRVVRDPNGGIVFRYRGDGWAHVFHVWDDGTVEHFEFDGTRLVDREMVTWFEVP